MKKYIKKSLSILLSLLVILSIAPMNLSLFAGALGDGITWSYEGTTLTVSGSGELSSEYTSTEEWQELKDMCTTVKIGEGITIIGNNAFENFSRINKIELPDGITKIGAYAFHNCAVLNKINLPDTVTIIGKYAFAGCPSIGVLNIPKNIVEIGEWAFKGCTCFTNTNLVIPDTIQKVSLGAFSTAQIRSLTIPFLGTGSNGADYNGTSTNHIGYIFGDEQWSSTYACYDSVSKQTYYLPDSLKTVTITKYINKNNFENAEKIEKIIIKDTVVATEVPDYFAKSCKALNSIVLENSENITRIGRYAFFSCWGLEEVVIPKNVTVIDNDAYGNCLFTSLHLSENLKEIDTRAFQVCQNFTTLVIPQSVESIGTEAFGGCTNLEYITFPDNMPQIHESAFWGTKYEELIDIIPDEEPVSDFSIDADGTLTAYSGTDENVVVPKGVKRIGTVFAEKEFIKTITFPNTLEIIEYRAFDGCKGITELVIPDSVTLIESEAFAGLCQLRKLTVPFVGKSRDVETDSREALIGYWFGSSNDHDCIYNCYGAFTEIKQTYNNTNYFKRSYKPRYFTELTVTDSILRSNALQNYGLTVLNIGANVTAIEEYAANDIGLEQINFNENVQIIEIPDYAFCNNKITSITIPKSVKKIGKAFICDDFSENILAEITLNEGLEIIDGAFAGSKISSVKFPNTLKEITNYAFYNCVNLEYIEFPENLTTIGRFSFKACWNLKEVVFSDSITVISDCAFLWCGIKKVVIPEGMQAIVEQTFCNCEDLEIVVIGGKVEEIGAEAFANCPSLETVVIPDNVTSISDNAFSEASENLVIYCNEGSYAQAYAIKNNIKYTTLVLDAIPNQTYTGKAIEPVVKARVNNRQLTLNSEYRLSFKDNIEAGVATVSARGLGDFKHLIATGKFNILQRQLNAVKINFNANIDYSPKGVEPEFSLYINDHKLTEGEDYEIIGRDKINGVGNYNVTIKGKGNLMGTQNLTLEVLPRSITETRITSSDTIKVTDSQYTLVEGVDYKIENRIGKTGEKETYIVGIGNYNGEELIRATNNSFSANIFLNFFALIEKLLSMLFGIF